MLSITFQAFLVIFLFYVIGTLTYKTKEQKRFKFLKVLITFFATQVLNAIILLFMLLVSTTLLLTISTYFVSTNDLVVDAPLFTNNDKFSAGNTLLIILIFVLLASIIQFKLRKIALKKFPSLRLDLDEYEICEYFIQWMTIYLVIYQFLFDGLKEASKFLADVTTVDNVFTVVLSPDNINMVMQPLLIATWIVMVMEKINLRESIELEAKLELEVDGQKVVAQVEATKLDTDCEYAKENSETEIDSAPAKIILNDKE